MNIENNEHSFRPHPELGEHISFTKEQPIDIHDSLASLIETVAPLEIDLVLEGETGTGKDTLARKIHRLSGCSGRLIAVNCAAIPETLAESELLASTTELTPVLCKPERVTSKKQITAFCFSTRSIACHYPCRPNYCEYSKTVA